MRFVLHSLSLCVFLPWLALLMPWVSLTVKYIFISLDKSRILWVLKLHSFNCFHPHLKISIHRCSSDLRLFCQTTAFYCMLIASVAEYKKNVAPVDTERFHRFLVSYSQGNKREGSLANFPPCLSQVGFPHWTQGQARMLSRFFAYFWFKEVYQVMLRYGPTWCLHMEFKWFIKELWNVRYLFQMPPHAYLFSFIIFQLHHQWNQETLLYSSAPTPSLYSRICPFQFRISKP